MTFKNTEEAKTAYIEGHKIAKKASGQGDYKTNNKIIKEQVNPAFNYLKKNNQLKVLCKYLEQDDDISLKQSTAVALLPHYEDISLKVLKGIANKDDSLQAFKAEMVIKQWKKGLF